MQFRHPGTLYGTSLHVGSGCMRTPMRPLYAYPHRPSIRHMRYKPSSSTMQGHTVRSDAPRHNSPANTASKPHARVETSPHARTNTQQITEAVNNALRPRNCTQLSNPPPTQRSKTSKDKEHNTQPVWRGNACGPEQPLRALFASGAQTLTPPSATTNRTPHTVIAIGRAGPLEGAPDLQHSQRSAFETAALSQLQQMGVGSCDKCIAFMVRGSPKTASYSVYTIWNTHTPQGRQVLQEILSKQALTVPWRGIRVAVPIDIAPTPPPPNAMKLLTTHLNPYLACAGYTQTILRCAGYETVHADNNSFQRHPTHVQIISEHLGEATWLFGPTSSGNAGAILSWVIPPANDPLLEHMPSCFSDAEGKTTFIKVFRPAKPHTQCVPAATSTPHPTTPPQSEPTHQGLQQTSPVTGAPEAMEVEQQNLHKRRSHTEPQNANSLSTPDAPSHDAPSPTKTPSKRGKPTTPQAYMDIDTSIPSSPQPRAPPSQQLQAPPQPASSIGTTSQSSKPPWEGHPFTAQVNQYLEDTGTPPTPAHKANALNYLYANNKALFDQNAHADERPTNLSKKVKLEISKALRYTSATSTRSNNHMQSQQQDMHDQVMHSPGVRTPRGVQPQ